MDQEKDKIEEAGILAVRQYLLRCPRIKPVIYDNDKTQFWDGDINIYKDEEKENKKENFHGRVPVQVKGRSDTTTDFRIGRADAEAYKNDGGCLFFKVLVGENYSTTVLYAFLSSGYLNTLLQQTTQTFKIDLNPVPYNPLDFEKELYTFAASRNNEKVDNTSPKEIQKLVEGFEEIRGHLKEIKDKGIRMELESSLDVIKNLKDERPDEKDTIGWRDKFYYHSRKAIDLAINNIEGHDFAELQFKLGKYLQDQKQYHLAEDYYLKVLKEYRKRAEAHPYPWRKNAVARTLNNLAILHSCLTRYDEAEQEYNEALEIRRELAKTNRDAYIGNVADTLNNLAILHKNLTRYDEAEREYKEALKIYRELAEANRDAYIGDVAMTLNNLAALHDDLTRYDEAEKEYKEALEIRRELAKTNRDAYIGNVADTLNNLAILHWNIKRYSETENEHNEALEIYRELTKNNHEAFISDVAWTLNGLGCLHYDLTRYEEAEKEYNEALKIRRELAKTNHDAYIGDVAMTLENIARLQEATNRKVEAKKSAEEALGIYKELAKAYPQIWKKDVEDTEQLLKDLSE